MRSTSDEFITSPFPVEGSLSALVLGQIVDVSPDGKLVVDYPGNEFGPIEAGGVCQERFSGEYAAGHVVLLAFPGQDLLRPIVLGAIFDTCHALSPALRATLDHKRLVLKADREILLECGHSSVLLRSDGKIILRGVEIVSRASRSNKVRGACVKIN
jgi:hypothetical protein